MFEALMPYGWAIKIGAVALFFGGVYFAGYHQGKKAIQADFDAYRVSVLQRDNGLLAEHARQIAEAKRLEDEARTQVAVEHEKALNKLRMDYDEKLASVRASGGLRVPRSICNATTSTDPKTASPSGSNEDFAGTVALPEQVTEGLFDLAEAADEITEQLRACQGWIRKSGFYSVQAALKPQD